MELPFNMMTPRMKLADGEELEASFPALRKKGIFGNRYGALVVTNQRVGFVKAIMKSGLISAAANKLGARPMIEYARRTSATAERVQLKKLVGVQITSGATVEKFMLDEAAIPAVIAALTGA